jgi:hypothetical protein
MKMRHASGVREHDLIDRAERLRESVDGLLPRLTDGADRDRFDKLRAELESVREDREDAKRLDRDRRWGDPMARAYAGLLHYYLERELPEVISFAVPGGEVQFAPLSKAPREVEAAVQQFDDPRRLILGYLEWARRGYHFFVVGKELWSSGRSPVPPPSVVPAKLAALPYRLQEGADAGRWECPHLHQQDPRPYLEVRWEGAGVAFRVCRKCVKGERQLLASLTEGTAVPDPSAEFPVSAALNVRCLGGGGCVHADLPPISKSLRRAYEYGRISDAQLLDGYLAEIRPRLGESDRPAFVAGGVCYGADAGRFLDALAPSPLERKALEAVLAHRPGLFEIDEPSASRALERLWPEAAEEIVGTIVADPAEAQRWIRDARANPGRVAELLKRAQRKSDERELLGALPRYATLAAEARYVDSVARAFRTQGPGGAERTALEQLPKEGRERGLAYAFLRALDRARTHDWRFSPTEREFGSSLTDRARELLGAPPERYHDALDRFLRSAGVADWGSRHPGDAR